mmetsp:Transcript_35916/g.66166  ORF Transcript_35916/g.66166 Transcript_35916/m.66166 type:complete len:171 (-) Transcript_35916:139-651(-)
MIVAPKQRKTLPPKKAFPQAMRLATSTDVNPAVVQDAPIESIEAANMPQANKSPLPNRDFSKDYGTHTVYRDFSHVEADQGAIQMASNKEPTFIVKLHQMLSNPDISGIISWLPHGRAWRILQRKAFEDQVIPLYFRHCRYSSFMRQVNGWGFRRVTNGTDYNAYYHEVR